MRNTIFPIVTTAFLSVVLGLICYRVFHVERSHFVPESLAQSLHTDENYLAGLTTEEKINIRIYEEASKGVVNITTQSRRENFFYRETIAQGEGSGFVIDKNGHIATNFHVIASATEIQVTLFSGNSYSAQLVGADPANDTAIIRVKAPEDELFPVRFGDSSRLKVGQKVYAIGNPFGLELTLSTGVISSLNRSLPSQNQARTIKQVVQIDAAINPGNSGGPLLDSYGELIGMNTAIASRSGDSAGVGFAIPVNTITRIIPQLIEHGRVIRPNLGIEQVMKTEFGLLITRVQPGGPAAAAGLAGPQIVTKQKRQGPYLYEYQAMDRQSAQFIVGINKQPVATPDDLLSVVESFRPGDTVTLLIEQAGRRRSVEVVLGQGE
ncbi:MAG: trypsin-like peptidase domain-containing protein [Planctomycetia bacterium]|nr:trypsin-like peptidase domain-containing protein [Planctomycetia bacterium]